MRGAADDAVGAHDHRLHEERAVVRTDGAHRCSRVDARASANRDKISRQRHLAQCVPTNADFGVNGRAEQTQVDPAHRRCREEDNSGLTQDEHARREPPAQVVTAPQLVATCLAAAEDEPFERNAEERQHEIQYDSMGKYDGHEEGENKKMPKVFGMVARRVEDHPSRGHEDDHECGEMERADHRMDEEGWQSLQDEHPHACRTACM